MYSSTKERCNECIEYHATKAAEAFITFTGRQSHPNGDTTVSSSFFLEFIEEITAQALLVDLSERKENRPVSAPTLKTSHHAPHPLVITLAPTLEVLRTFNDEKDKQALASLFYEIVKKRLTDYYSTRPSTPAKYFRPLTPVQE